VEYPSLFRLLPFINDWVLGGHLSPTLAYVFHLAQDHSLQTEARRSQMAKGQLRSNREKKKPKQAKAKPTGTVSQFSGMQAKPVAASSSGKKQ
jgi:hypothetical protein